MIFRTKNENVKKVIDFILNHKRLELPNKYRKDWPALQKKLNVKQSEINRALVLLQESGMIEIALVVNSNGPCGILRRIG